MKIAFIFFAAIIALFGIRFLLAGVKSFVLFFKVDNIPLRAKKMVVRDFVMGILFLLLAVAMITCRLCPFPHAMLHSTKLHLKWVKNDLGKISD